ncbi:hypothetical protein NIES2100_41330 [Calothrix sp. NIES-2100]|uniref:hypothetical protein n=1 Tax=Calothrix sp. NIES-2100 TaxID=1954172 RepID=UPI000B60D157|nr:hypothetical protein NIES2100_41330 [Calothrix sp. NIES-2100]
MSILVSILDFLVSINGVGKLWAADGQFLGVLSSDRYDSNSINNPDGMYGGTYGIYSISNPYGVYGGTYGIYSPYNTYCINPPFVVYQGQVVLVLSKNANFQSNGVPVIDPDLLVSVYAKIGQPQNPFYSSVASKFDSGWG